MEKKKIKEQHFIQEIERLPLMKFKQMDLTEILFNDGSTELWIIIKDNYDEDGRIISTIYYKGYDVLGEYFYEDGTIVEEKIR